MEKTRIEKLRELAKMKQEERENKKNREYIEFIYDMAEMVAKKGLFTFVINIDEIANQTLDKGSSETFSKTIITLLQNEGFKCQVEWTHPDCYLYKFCEKNCKPERLKISFE